MRVGERGDRLGADQRRIAVQHDHGAVAAKLTRSSPDCVGGSAGLLLDRDRRPAIEQSLERPIGPIDHHDPLCASLARRSHGPGDHRPPAQGMKHLRGRGAHPRALARGEDHHDWRGHAGIVAASRY
jgi:hypothetical protein